MEKDYIKIINWILENKEWLFSGIGVMLVSFVLGRKSVQWNVTLDVISKKMIKSNGINNRAAETYHEDHSVHYNIQEVKTLVKRKIPDYTTGIALAIGASGCVYTAPRTGFFCSIGLDGTAIINDLVKIALIPHGTQIEVEKEDTVKIIYTQQSLTKKELLFFAKKDLVDD